MRVKGFNIIRQEPDWIRQHFAKVGDLARPEDLVRFANGLHDDIRESLKTDADNDDIPDNDAFPSAEAVRDVVRRNIIPELDYPKIIEAVSDYLYQRMLRF